MPDQATRGTVLIAKDGRLCVLRDSLDDSLVFVQHPWYNCFLPLVDYNGVKRSTKVPGQIYKNFELLEGNAELIGQGFRKNNIGKPKRSPRRRLIMDILAMTYEQTDGDLKPSPKFRFYAAELTNPNGRAIEVRGKDCRYPYRPPEHRLLDVDDELFPLAAEWYKSIIHGSTDFDSSLSYEEDSLVSFSEESDSGPPKSTPERPTIPKKRKRTATKPSTASGDKRRGKSPPPKTNVSTDCGDRKRPPLKTQKTTKLAAKNAVFSAKQALLFNPSNEEDQDDEETLPASKLEEEAQPEAQSRTPAQREGAGVAKIATAPVGDASSVVRPAEGNEDEDMDAEDIDLEMRHVELEQRKIRLHQMRRALEKKKRRRKEG